MSLEIHRIDARTHPAAVDAVRELLAEAERADGFPSVSDQALLAAGQGRREVLLAAVAGAPAAAAGILGEGELDLVVRPAERGRGLGTRLLGTMLDAIPTADSNGAGTAELRAWAHGENPAAEALLSRAGFAPVRSLYRLALDPAALPGAIDAARELPEGFAVQAFDPRDDEQAERWVRVNAAAFASHPEQGAVTLEDFAATTREAWFDPEDLLLAFDTGATTSSGERRSSGADDEDDDRRHGRLAGYTWIKTIRTPGHTETELYVLGVDPAYAGRGLGAALLGETLRRMAAHAPDRITLYVDGDNGTARGLYDRAGFTVDQRSTQWLRAGGDAGIGAGGDEPGRQDRTGA